MYTTLVALCLVASSMASILPPADRYPAGVSPAACPRYPYCDPLVDPTSGHIRAYAGDNTYAYRGAHALGVAPYAAAPLAYAGGLRAYAPLPYAAGLRTYAAAPALVAAPAYAVGKQVPANVNPAACLNYPYCDTANPLLPGSGYINTAAH